MTTDRELLELAAKAAGYEFRWEHLRGAGNECARAREPRKDAFPNWFPIWNPITDDGDALRLAVKLQIDSWFLGEGAIQAARKGRPIQTEVVHDGADPCTATRRAIVRAAAEIGRTM